MVYIAPDGRVLQAKPWGLHTITDFFWGIIAFFVFSPVSAYLLSVSLRYSVLGATFMMFLGTTVR